MRKNIYYWLCLTFIGLSLGACMRELDTPSATTQNMLNSEFEVVSVISHQQGESIALSLELDQSGEDLRSIQMREASGSGELSSTAVGTTEQMHLYLYKEGDPASLSMATVTWQGRTETSIKLDKINFQLAEGYTFKVGDIWLVAGVLGGKLDTKTGKIQMGTPRNMSGYNIIPSGGMVDMPYALSWQRLTINRDNYGTIPKTSLQPMGSLLRLHFYSNLLEDYQASALQLETNALSPTGTFDFIADKTLGALPKWTAEESDSETPKSWIYQLGNPHAELLLSAGQGYTSEQTLYLWTMPTSISEDKTATKIKINVAPIERPAEITTQITYDRKKHRTLKSGSSYRLSNILTSDLIISEVYYQFSAAGQNSADNANQNYSIVELYNPTASEIDLSNYALARTVFYANSRYAYSTQANLGDMPNNDYASIDYQKVFMMALSSVMGNSYDYSGFSSRMGHYGTGRASGTGPQGETITANWYRVVYGTPTLKLKAGQTVLIGADGYIPRYYTDRSGQNNLFSPTYNPGKNIEDYNTLYRSNPTLASQYSEKDYLPRAGMQIDSAVRAGYAQFMVALDNGSSSDKKQAPNATARTGIMLMDNGDGFALFKRSFNEEGGRSLQLVDITTPVVNAEASRRHREKLVREYNQVARNQISGLISKDRIAYSVVRVAKSNFPRTTYVAEDWQVAVSENDGIKSLGTRHYVAGLSPFGHNNTGYHSTNNPKNLPFWSMANPFVPLTKLWTELPSKGQNGYNDGITALTEDGYRVATIGSATATEQQTNYPIQNSFDGDPSTFYHSKNKSENPAFPITLTYNFAKPENLSYILYQPRNKEGSIAQVEITATYEDGSSAVVFQGNLQSPTTTTRITWPGIESRKIKSIAFKVISTYYGVLAVAEMQFMQRVENYTDPTTIFSDILCTQLRAGITYSEIMAIADPFYRDLARQIYQGTYNTEFRVASYKSYPNPDLQKAVNLTQFSYSLYDNPTGISVGNGDRIVVFVDNPGGREAKLAVHDFDALPSDRDHKTEYPLKQGINIITSNRSGLLYLLYHSPDAQRGSLPNIRLHIAGGKVNGYYDSTNPKHQGRWRELISNATNKHFDVLSNYTHLIYQTEKFRDFVADPKPLLDMYDKFVISEWELLGLYKYNRVFQNRMEYRVIYDGYMYAFHNRTGYNANTMSTMMTAEGLRTNPWGPAHEMGHMNQTIGLNWGGMIEVTVNIFASYVQFVVLGNPFRGLHENDDWFTRAWNRLLQKPNVTLSTVSTDGDPVVSMFQLELYIGQVLGKTPSKMTDKGGFYPELFELLRQAHAGKGNVTAHAETNGDQQAELAYYASRAANLDLTEFFERWGYLRPANNVGFVNTYNNKFYITLTEAKANEVRAKIKALNLPKPAVDFEYITSRNMELFRNPKAIVPGTASLNGRTLRFLNWQNVVAWEVVDASGNLIYTSTGWHRSFDANTAGFDMPTNTPWQTGYRVRAISATGQRTVVAL